MAFIPFIHFNLSTTRILLIPFNNILRWNMMEQEIGDFPTEQKMQFMRNCGCIWWILNTDVSWDTTHEASELENSKCNYNNNNYYMCVVGGLRVN